MTDVGGVSMNLMCRKDFVISDSQREMQYSRIVILYFSFLSTGWAVRGSNPGGGEIFRTRPDRPRVPPSLLYNGYRVSFSGVKRPGRGVDHPPPSSAEVKERLQLYIYSPYAFVVCSRVNLPFSS